MERGEHAPATGGTGFGARQNRVIAFVDGEGSEIFTGQEQVGRARRAVLGADEVQAFRRLIAFWPNMIFPLFSQ